MGARNVEIEMYRGLMSILIAILHFSEDYTGTTGIFPGAYLGVEFYFIISGYFLMSNFLKYNKEDFTPAENALVYIKNRIRKLYPAYLCAIIIMTVIIWGVNGFGLRNLVDSIWNYKWQYVFAHFLGVEIKANMRSIWFMSSLLIVSYIIYFFLCYKKDLFLGLSPVVAILLFVYMSETVGHLCVFSIYIGVFNGGFIRAFAEMSLGVYLKFVLEQIKGGTKKFLLLRIACWGIIFYIVRYKGLDSSDFVALLAMVILICLAVKYPIKMVGSKVWTYLGKISYPIFLFHLPISMILTSFFPGRNYYVMLIVFIILVILGSGLYERIERSYLNLKKSTSCF